MKKRKNRATNGEAEETKTPMAPRHFDTPQGYEKKTSDLVGFWKQDGGPVHFQPLYAKAFDSGLDERKATVIIVGHAIGDKNECVDAEQEDVTPKAGELIGVWYKPGMAQIKTLAHAQVFMYMSGEKDTGKPNPMATFEIAAKGKGGILYLQDDFRKKSLNVSIPFESKQAIRAARSAPVEDEDEDFGGSPRDIPF